MKKIGFLLINIKILLRINQSFTSLQSGYKLFNNKKTLTLIYNLSVFIVPKNINVSLIIDN